jgi:hypothetical protein
MSEHSVAVTAYTIAWLMALYPYLAVATLVIGLVEVAVTQNVTTQLGIVCAVVGVLAFLAYLTDCSWLDCFRMVWNLAGVVGRPGGNGVPSEAST